MEGVNSPIVASNHENLPAEGNATTLEPVDLKDADSPSLERVIYTYLLKKGFQETLPKFVAEAKELQSSVAEPNAYSRLDASVIELLLESEKAFEPNAYLNGYAKLRSWINDSLELYKPELWAFLFPLFVHSYLDLVSRDCSEKAREFFSLYTPDHDAFHHSDIQALCSIKASQHVNENEIAQLYRNNKYTIKVSKVGFELFISYLQDNQLMTILRLINDRFAIKVVITGIPGVGELAEPVVGITGHANSQLASFNEKRVKLGHPPLPNDSKAELELLLREEDFFQKRKRPKDENATLTSLLESYKKYSATKLAGGFARDEIPLPPVKGTDIMRFIQEFKDINNQATLVNRGSASICFYTFHNTFGSLNTVSISDDLKFLAAGFSDSYIKLWSLRGDTLRGLKGNFNPTMVNEESDLDRMRKTSGTDTKRLIGHSGPVYGLSFSPDSKHLLSCSEDSTGNAVMEHGLLVNLVCYKGHNYPVWDVDFSPLGVYFASASHDRTARLWSCDHISPLRIFTGHSSDVDVVSPLCFADPTRRSVSIEFEGTCVRVFTGHCGAIYTLAISPDGRNLATAGLDGLIALWDIASGRMVEGFRPEKAGATHSVIFSNDSKVLISGGADKVVRLWDASKRRASTAQTTSPVEEAQPSGLLASYPTKETTITYLKCTPRNLILGAGCFTPHLG
ncbi:Transcription initiation factor TFIID subunit 5 [Massospora cicadina]|nr:Transcription initiation factor TFIID subunit 5 [Massospora cicadina]